MAKYQKYSEYKDSGVEWLGTIPNHWSLKKHKYIAVFSKGKNPELLFDNYSDGLYPYLSMDSLRGKVESKYAEYKKGLVLVQDNQPLIIWDGSNSGEFVLGKKGLLSSTMASASLIYKIQDKYYWYLCVCIEPEMRKYATGMGIPHVNGEELRGILLPLPDLNEQAQIANFLDHETAKIDTLIAKQEKLIELLKEKRQAVISHAVTKGLNPDVAMKDSGVEWLGQVPEHWIVKSYRHASKIYRGKFGHRPRNDPAFYDGEYPFIQTGDVARAGKYITSYSQTLNEKGKEVSQLFPKGTLMMAIAANIGDLAILGFEAYAPDSVVGFKPNQDIDLEFLRYSFKAALPALEQTSTQSTQANLNVERIGAVQGVFPSLNDQQEIVGYLDDMLNKYSVIEKEMHKAIELLQERRTALISSAVTGKIDVCNWQYPNEAKTELSA